MLLVSLVLTTNYDKIDIDKKLEISFESFYDQEISISAS